jgi:hypothetical protein
MVLVLIGYFCTMVSALVFLMVVLSGLVSSPETHQPHPVVAIAQTAAPDKKTAQVTPQATPTVPVPVVVSSARQKADALERKKERAKLARVNQKRKLLAEQREPSGYSTRYSTALGYGREFPAQPAPVDPGISPFAAPRF